MVTDNLTKLLTYKHAIFSDINHSKIVNKYAIVLINTLTDIEKIIILISAR